MTKRRTGLGKFCASCLAPETFKPSGEWRPGHGGNPISSLGKDGRCTDRSACELRAPVLFDQAPESNS